MSGLVALLGEKLVSSSGESNTAELLAGKEGIALYFSAHWCPPCRGFTPKLAEWYTTSLKQKGLEVVFVSSDKDEDSFKEYFKEMPWLSLPYADRERKEMLSTKFKVQGVPTVVILDKDGQVITKDGRAAISSDPTGEDFPWKPKSLKELLEGAKIISKGGAPETAAAIEGKVLALYFSAHWCPPCRGFTPKLAEWYSKSLKDKGLEVVFVSSDREQAAFDSYFGEMPWLALDYSDRKLKEQLSNLFGVSGIPSVVIIDKDGSIISKNGRAAISGDPEGLEFPWHPKPVGSFKNGPGSIQEVPTVIALCETSDASAQKAIEETMTPVAREYISAQKAAGEEDPKFSFMMATEAGSIPGQLRKLMSLPGLPPSTHEHPLEKKEPGGGWGCDGCDCSGSPDKERYRCTSGCDFDYCGDCHAKSGKTEPHPPKLMLMDIPSDGAFYEGPEGEITADTITKFLADFQAGALERKQLSRG